MCTTTVGSASTHAQERQPSTERPRYISQLPVAAPNRSDTSREECLNRRGIRGYRRLSASTASFEVHTKFLLIGIFSGETWAQSPWIAPRRSPVRVRLAPFVDQVPGNRLEMQDPLASRARGRWFEPSRAHLHPPDCLGGSCLVPGRAHTACSAAAGSASASTRPPGMARWATAYATTSTPAMA